MTVATKKRTTALFESLHDTISLSFPIGAPPAADDIDIAWRALSLVAGALLSLESTSPEQSGKRLVQFATVAVNTSNAANKRLRNEGY